MFHIQESTSHSVRWFGGYESREAAEYDIDYTEQTRDVASIFYDLGDVSRLVAQECRPQSDGLCVCEH